MKNKVGQEKIQEFKEAFKQFDQDNDGYIEIGRLPQLVRSLKQAPSKDDLTNWTNNIDEEKKGKFDLKAFLRLMELQYREPETQEELIQIMKQIFKPTGPTITVQRFKNVMTNLGDKMTEDELNQLFKELKMDNQESINYEEFVRSIYIR